ncbi:unnamed protein product [Blepharisma stoltei]|uniref:Uncharacterized protein n=1 Tax=Blepharisma stoltei TaxID=1481888 RepID=A0AAU9J8G9_9CILI|nr:unnamed protein product [Blepharisma stoltei]
MSSVEEKEPIIQAFQRFLEIEREVQGKFQAFIQNFEEEMHEFFQEHLLPLSGVKFVTTKIEKLKPEPLQLPVKRPKEHALFKKPQIPVKKGENELSSHMELIKTRVRDLYEKNISPSLISKLFNLSLELVHSLGDWKQVPSEIASKMIEMKNDCIKLRDKGSSLKDISKAMRIPKKKVLILYGEITPNDLLKSAESKKVIVKKIAEGVSKVALSQELGMPVYKIQNWLDKVANGRELSDEDSIHSEGEFQRDTIRNSIFYYYQTNNKDLAASICNTKPEKVARWVDRFENGADPEALRFKKPVNVQEQKEIHTNSLIADFLKRIN